MIAVVGVVCEVFAKTSTITTANAWNKLSVDFSDYLGTDHNKVVIFINAGQDPGGTYYLDNLKWARPGYNGCILTFETAGLTIDNFAPVNSEIDLKYFLAAEGSCENFRAARIDVFQPGISS